MAFSGQEVGFRKSAGNSSKGSQVIYSPHSVLWC